MQKQLVHIDDFIAYQAGDHIITLRWTNHGVYTVTVYNGTLHLDDLGGTFATETEARLIARGHAQMFLAEHQAKLAATEPAAPVFVPTRTRVHTKPLTPAELDLIRSHTGGVVRCKPGQSWLMLRAIHRRIGGHITYRPGTRIISSLTLNAAGLALAETTGVAA